MNNFLKKFYYEFLDFIHENPIVLTILYYLFITWIILEVIFYLALKFIIYPKLNKTKRKNCNFSPYTHEDLLHYFLNILSVNRSTSNVYNIKNFFIDFFLLNDEILTLNHKNYDSDSNQLKFEDIYEENYESLLSWAMYDTTLSSIKRIIKQPKKQYELNKVEANILEKPEDTDEESIDDIINITITDEELILKPYDSSSVIENKKKLKNIRNFIQILKKKSSEFSNLKPGYNKNIKHINFSLNSIPYSHRFLIMYITVGILEFFFNNFVLLLLFNFQHLSYNNTGYYIRLKKNTIPVSSFNEFEFDSAFGSSYGVQYINEPQEQNTTETKERTLVIFHGITTGWSLYMLLVNILSKDYENVVLVDYNGIKMKSLNFIPQPPSEFVENFKQILLKHNLVSPQAFQKNAKPNSVIPSTNISAVGHSFGTILIGWIANLEPNIFSHITLVDPVSLLLCYPHVAFNFLYKSKLNISEFLIRTLAGNEITITNYLYKYFVWKENNFWIEKLNKKTGLVISLSENDEIVSCNIVQEYINYFTQLRKDREYNPKKFERQNYSEIIELLEDERRKNIDIEMQNEYNIRRSLKNDFSQDYFNINSSMYSSKIPTTNYDPTYDPIGPVSLVIFDKYSHGQLMVSPTNLHKLKQIIDSSEKIVENF